MPAPRHEDRFHNACVSSGSGILEGVSIVGVTANADICAGEQQRRYGIEVVPSRYQHPWRVVAAVVGNVHAHVVVVRTSSWSSEAATWTADNDSSSRCSHGDALTLINWVNMIPDP